MQNVAHLLKYRRCIKLAKLLYKRQGVGPLHDQYEGKLLNKELAHAHQDESDTEMGIARRIIRQAHVSNYTHYSYTDASKRNAPVIEGNRLNYYPELYNTNPPMAPIMCSAPPRMGKSALTMLVASFAVKLGGRVEPKPPVSATLSWHPSLVSASFVMLPVGSPKRTCTVVSPIRGGAESVTSSAVTTNVEGSRQDPE